MAVYKRNSRGQIVKRGDGTYYYDFTINGVRYKQALRGITTEAQAKRIESLKRQEVYEGRYTPELEPMSFQRFIDDVYRPRRKRTIKSFYYYEGFIKIFCKYFGSKLLKDIKPAEIEAYRNYRQSQPSKHGRAFSLASLNREMMMLSSVFRLAVDLEYREANPCRKIKPYKAISQRTRVLQPNEVEKLLNALTGTSEKLHAVVLLLLHTGMRLGEGLALRWNWIDLDKGEIILPAEITKTGKPRALPLNEKALAVLTSLHSEAHAAGKVFTGEGFSKGHVSKLIAETCDRIGMPDVSAHTLRHTFATWLIEKGANPLHIKELLGHTTLKMAQRYMHISTEALRQTVKILESSAK